MNLFIGCSASLKIDDKYISDCSELIKMIAEIPDVNLIYGAYNRGLMGLCYSEFKKNNKKVTGIITKYHDEIDGDEIVGDKKIVVPTTTARFNEIFSNSHMVLILPGGLGTYAEIFSAIEESRIGNKKKIILYNCNYFYTPIIKELYHLYEEGFIDMVPSEYMIIESDKNKIIEMIKEMI